MTRQAVTTHAAPTGSHRRRAGGRLALVASAFALVVTALGVNASASVAPRGSATSSASSPRLAPTALYPIGVADPSEPSGFAPPLPTSMSGYRETYVNDFSGTSLPAGWYTFSGEPGGDPGGLLASSHVQVANGELQLLTTYVPSVGKWVTGGLCQCGLGHVFGAYFVRSRITGPGRGRTAVAEEQHVAARDRFQRDGIILDAYDVDPSLRREQQDDPRQHQHQHDQMAHVGCRVDQVVDRLHRRRPGLGKNRHDGPYPKDSHDPRSGAAHLVSAREVLPARSGHDAGRLGR